MRSTVGYRRWRSSSYYHCSIYLLAVHMKRRGYPRPTATSFTCNTIYPKSWQNYICITIVLSYLAEGQGVWEMKQYESRLQLYIVTILSKTGWQHLQNSFIRKMTYTETTKDWGSVWTIPAEKIWMASSCTEHRKKTFIKEFYSSTMGLLS